MVNVMKGVLVECDPAMKQFLLHLDETRAFGKEFIIQDLDETHIFISADILETLQDRVDDLMDKLSFPLVENNKSVGVLEAQTLLQAMAVCSEAVKSLPEWVWQHTKRRLLPGNPLWEDGDYFCCLAAKHLPMIDAEEEDNMVGEFTCSLTGCGQVFDSIVGYEMHYSSVHRNACTVCRRSFPTNHLLDIHISEQHDALFEILASKTNMYKCLVESCIEKFSQPKFRKDHMISVHKYPASYRFDRQKNSKQKQSKQSTEPMDVTGSVESSANSIIDNPEQTEHVDVSGKGPSPVTTGRQFSYKVPYNVCFGHGASRGFHSRGGKNKCHSKGKKKHWHQHNSPAMDTSVSLEQVNMGELASALESS